VLKSFVLLLVAPDTALAQASRLLMINLDACRLFQAAGSLCSENYWFNVIDRLIYPFRSSVDKSRPAA